MSVPAGPGIRGLTGVFYRRYVDRNLLSTHLSGAGGESEKRDLFPFRRRRGASGAEALPALPAGIGAGECRLAGCRSLHSTGYAVDP